MVACRFIGHTKDSLWSVDLFRCESVVLQSYWVPVVMDQLTRRIIGFGIQCGDYQHFPGILVLGVDHGDMPVTLVWELCQRLLLDGLSEFRGLANFRPATNTVRLLGMRAHESKFHSADRRAVLR